MEFKEKLRRFQDAVEKAIDDHLPTETTRPARLHEAMRYSLVNGGKRIRPALALASCELYGNFAQALPAAIAIECLHTYSLIHDDLPGIDDSPLRRGKPASHIAFDVATAILAGDALLTYAFQILSENYAAEPERGIQLIRELSNAAGSERLIGGQMEDILGEHKSLSAADLEYIHLNKTSALIEASVAMGAIAGGANEEELSSFRNYGHKIGLCFQVVDDILDATSDSEAMGKPTQSDAALEKTTFVSVYGIEKSRSIAQSLTEEAVEACSTLPGDTTFLADLAKELGHRVN